MDENEKLAKEAVRFVRANKQALVEKFVGKDLISVRNPISVFMAGSPGAGKTEFSKEMIRIFEAEGNLEKIIRIDPDEFRLALPGYTGSNSAVFQRAASLAVEIIHDHVLYCGKHFVLDGTLSNFERAKNNVRRSLEKRRTVEIYYLYQDPALAWEITQKRESIDGRRITKEIFVDRLLGAYDTVNLLKKEFNENIVLNAFTRDARQEVYSFRIDIEDIDKFITINHNRESLLKKL